MLDFRAVLSKLLYTFYSSGNGFNHNLHVVFYVGFRNFHKKQTLKINQLKIKRPVRKDDSCFFVVGDSCE